MLSLISKDLGEMEARATSQIKKGKFDLLEPLHHITSGMKAFSTDTSCLAVDELRQACGGVGFLSAAGIADQQLELAPYTTFEGVNVVMLQQSSRMLLRQAKNAASGKALDPFFSYLSKSNELLSNPSGARSVAEFLDLEHL